MMPLSFASPGEENIIKRIGGKPEVKRHLENLGFVAGATVTVITETAGNLIVNVKETRVAINKDMAQKIYAGADMFLMPSISEPCGLSQMIALRYGTVPIVRATGGLGDSIEDCGDGTKGNGFVFGPATADALKEAVLRATGLYYDYKDIWNGLRQRAIECDYSWKESAVKYKEFYDEMF